MDGLHWLLVGGWLLFGIAGQYLWSECQRLASLVLDSYEWIDAIIDALENPSEEAGDQQLDKLVKQRKGD